MKTMIAQKVLSYGGRTYTRNAEFYCRPEHVRLLTTLGSAVEKQQELSPAVAPAPSTTPTAPLTNASDVAATEPALDVVPAAQATESANAPAAEAAPALAPGKKAEPAKASPRTGKQKRKYTRRDMHAER